MKKSIYLSILATMVAGTVPVVANTARANLSNVSLVAAEFEIPEDSVPKTSIGERVRGQVQFVLPESETPNSSASGGLTGDLSFAPPEDEAQPHSTVGGSVRGDVVFGLPGEGSTSNSSASGGLTGDLSFAPPEDEAQPNSTVGGSVRGDVVFGLPGEGSTSNSSASGGLTDNLYFDPPPEEGQPEETVGSGVRSDDEMAFPTVTVYPGSSIGGDVRSEILPLTALVPPTKHGLTVAARPTIYVYLPPVGAQTVFFSLQDEAGNPHYHTILEVPADSGVLSISLPAEAAALELEKNYLWYLAPIEPGGVLRPDNYAVTGWVKRVDAMVNQSEFADSPVKLATEYAQAGIWYETLTVLVEAQRSEPDNQTLAWEWHDLLEQVGLEAIASEPIYLIN